MLLSFRSLAGRHQEACGTAPAGRCCHCRKTETAQRWAAKALLLLAASGHDDPGTVAPFARLPDLPSQVTLDAFADSGLSGCLRSSLPTANQDSTQTAGVNQRVLCHRNSPAAQLLPLARRPVAPHEQPRCSLRRSPSDSRNRPLRSPPARPLRHPLSHLPAPGLEPALWCSLPASPRVTPEDALRTSPRARPRHKPRSSRPKTLRAEPLCRPCRGRGRA